MSITKTGILNENLFDEYHMEPDGSIWEHIFHHESLDKNNFGRNDTAFATGQVYVSPEMWFNFAICNQLSGSWELMLQQNVEVGSPIQKYRWIQNANPLTATFEQVAASNVTKITDGYNTCSYGGIYPIKSTSTYLCGNNGTQGNWWGAIGKYSIYQGGTPAWNGVIVKSGQIDVFVRVDSLVKNVKLYKMGNIMVGNNLYEY